MGFFYLLSIPNSPLDCGCSVQSVLIFPHLFQSDVFFLKNEAGGVWLLQRQSITAAVKVFCLVESMYALSCCTSCSPFLGQVSCTALGWSQLGWRTDGRLPVVTQGLWGPLVGGSGFWWCVRAGNCIWGCSVSGSCGEDGAPQQAGLGLVNALKEDMRRAFHQLAPCKTWKGQSSKWAFPCQSIPLHWHSSCSSWTGSSVRTAPTQPQGTEYPSRREWWEFLCSAHLNPNASKVRLLWEILTLLRCVREIPISAAKGVICSLCLSYCSSCSLKHHS